LNADQIPKSPRRLKHDIRQRKENKIGGSGKFLTGHEIVQAPSDYTEMAEFLLEIGIDSMSLNPDAFLKLD